jgi:hypothetical protein
MTPQAQVHMARSSRASRSRTNTMRAVDCCGSSHPIATYVAGRALFVARLLMRRNTPCESTRDRRKSTGALIRPDAVKARSARERVAFSP